MFEPLKGLVLLEELELLTALGERCMFKGSRAIESASSLAAGVRASSFPFGFGVCLLARLTLMKAAGSVCTPKGIGNEGAAFEGGSGWSWRMGLAAGVRVVAGGLGVLLVTT